MGRRILAAVILALAGCCSPAPKAEPASHRMTTEQWEKSLKGATEADVKRLLGPPQFADRDGVWTYEEMRWDPVTERRSPLYVEFDKGGRVRRVRP